MFKKLNSKFVKFLIVFYVLGFIVMSINYGEDKRTKIKNEAITMIEKGQLSEATKLLEEIKDDEYSKKLLNELSIINDYDTKFNFLRELSEEEFKKLKNNELVINKFSIPNLNNIFLSNVLKIENIDEIKKFQMALIEREKIDNKIKNAFSSWDGSHILVTKYLKKTLDDPKSYEHIETKYSANREKKTMVIYQKFRARNSYGGMVIAMCIATQDLNTGEITSIKIE